MALALQIVKLAFEAGTPVTYGVVTIGFAMVGFFAGSWTRRKRLRNKKTCKACADTSQDSLCLHSHEEEDNLLEYSYEGAPIPPMEHVPRPGSGLALNDAPCPQTALEPAARYDHHRAETMVKLAQQAYFRPEDGEGYRTHNIRGLPTVTFFDTSLFTKNFSGVLNVRIHRANHLRPADLDGSATAYAEVFVAASSFRTRSAGKTLNPVWEEEQWLYIKDPKYDSLCVRVVDEDRFTDTDDLGVAVLGLGGLTENPGEVFKFRLPLRGFAGENSTVTLSCRFVKFTESEGPETIPELKKLQPQEGNAIPSAKPEKVSKLGAGGFQPVAYLDCGFTDTQCVQAWVFACHEKRELVVAFRGTEQTRLSDLITDVRLMPCGFRTIIDTERKDINVHRGFMRAYRSVRRLIGGLLRDITDGRPEATEPGAEGADGAPSPSPSLSWEVLFTGHSLGGALATLGAYELGLYKQYAGCIRSVSLYTYGSPRVGNKAFAKEFDRYVPDAWRFTNRLDVVTSVPLTHFLFVFFKYRHVGHPVRLRKKGVLLKGLNNLELEEAMGKAEAIRKEIQADVFWLRALLSFRGFAEHSCELYESRLAEARAD